MGGIVGTGLQAALQARAGKKQRAWSKRRYAERYQVTMRDMKKAGLNPLLAAGMGLGGGSTPQGSMSQVPDMGGAANTAARVRNETATQRAQRELLGAQASTARTQAQVNVAQAAKLVAEEKVVGWKEPLASVGRDISSVYEGVKDTNWENTARNIYLNSLGSLKQLREENKRFYKKKRQGNYNPHGYDFTAKNKRNR